MWQAANHTGRINALAFSPDRQRLISAGNDETLRLWSVQSVQPLQRFLPGQLGAEQDAVGGLQRHDGRGRVSLALQAHGVDA